MKYLIDFSSLDKLYEAKGLDPNKITDFVNNSKNSNLIRDYSLNKAIYILFIRNLNMWLAENYKGLADNVDSKQLSIPLQIRQKYFDESDYVNLVFANKRNGGWIRMINNLNSRGNIAFKANSWNNIIYFYYHDPTNRKDVTDYDPPTPQRTVGTTGTLVNGFDKDNPECCVIRFNLPDFNLPGWNLLGSQGSEYRNLIAIPIVTIAQHLTTTKKYDIEEGFLMSIHDIINDITANAFCTVVLKCIQVIENLIQKHSLSNIKLSDFAQLYTSLAPERNAMTGKYKTMSTDDPPSPSIVSGISTWWNSITMVSMLKGLESLALSVNEWYKDCNNADAECTRLTLNKLYPLIKQNQYAFLRNLTPQLYQGLKSIRGESDQWKTDLSADMDELGF